MTAADRRCRWWGWGLDGTGPRLADRPGILPFLTEKLGLDGARSYPVPAADSFVLPESRLAGDLEKALTKFLPRSRLAMDHMERLAHACGRSYVDLMRLRLKTGLNFPDGILYPETPEDVQRAIDACGELGIALVPFGGGTSVVGGVEPLGHPESRACLTLDLARLTRVLEIDGRSQTALMEAGLLGPALEESLGQEHYTLGHFPQSFEFSTLGGWIATRSAGQNSAGYGRIDEMVDSLDMATPGGPMVVRPGPPGATGPSLRDIIVGSEGVFGVITRARMLVHETPESVWTQAFLFKDWTTGVEAIRHLVQEGLYPTIVRLSDPIESQVTARAAPAHKGLWQTLMARGARWVIKKRIGDSGCLLLLGLEGSERKVAWESRTIRRTLRGAGAFHLGSRPGDSWRKDRFSLPYLRDDLLGHGVLVETFETSTVWSSLERLRSAVLDLVSSSLAREGTPGLGFCHVSHVYHSGASLYFTVIAAMKPGAEIEQWQRIKADVTHRLLQEGGRLSHHHAVGADHRPFLAQEWGETGARLLRSMKDHMDPKGILNPGKLVP